MNKIEYAKQMQELEDQHRKNKARLHKEYAISNSTVLVGDIITDHLGSIKVEQIRVGRWMDNDHPQCVYHGERITKKGVPFKRAEPRDVWQSNLKTEAVPHAEKN